MLLSLTVKSCFFVHWKHLKMEMENKFYQQHHKDLPLRIYEETLKLITF